MMKGWFLKGAIIVSLILSLVMFFASQGEADGKEDMAKWKEGEARWRRLSAKKWTPAELKKLRQEAIESQPRAPEDKVITIRRGDTLWDLADGYFNNPWLWPRLWSYAGNLYIGNPHEITPGKKLVIPSRDVVGARPVTEVPVVIDPSIIRQDKAVADRLRKEIELLKKIKGDKEERITQLRQQTIDLKAKDIERERIKRKLEGKLEDALTDREIYERTVVGKKKLEIAQLSCDVENLKKQIYFLENELVKKESEIRAKEELIMAQDATIGSQIGQIDRLSTELDEERREMEQFFAFIGVVGGIICLSLSK